VTWVRGAAIRPVPAYARVPEATLSDVERDLAREEESPRSEVDEAFQRFEATQPNVAERMAEVLQKPIDETALALGYFLSIAIWLAFERTFGARLSLVTEEAVRATEDALTLEEELRATHAEEPLELDDVVAMEQPGVVGFIHEHVEAALDPHGEAGKDVDVDDVHAVYRAILVLTLALSHAVTPESGAAWGKGSELLA
jgi:hypothetical protein